MITPKEIEKRTMSSEKRESAQKDFIGFYIGRPITYLFTIPFLYTNISPDVVSYISFIPTILGFVLLTVGKSKLSLFLGWLCFFIWSMLDGIDGNIARYKEQYSKMGDTLDASAGYFAMALIFFGAGIAAAHDSLGIMGTRTDVSNEIYIILGGLSGFSMIIPRLVLHKSITSTGNKDTGGIKDRAQYTFTKVIALNITSVPGIVQILLLVCIYTHTLDIYTIGYFIINLIVMLITLKKIFNG